MARLRKARALNGHRDWVADRKARTRLLIEHGGLIVKAGLADRMEDNRATMLGALLMIRDLLDGAGDDSPADLTARWRRRGLRAFDADAAAKAASEDSRKADSAEEAVMPSS